jgi:hypothetical protein
MTKLDRARRFLKQTARPGFRVLSLALLAASAYAAGTISTPTVFNVAGTFDDNGGTLSGTVTIDTTGGGGILSEDLIVDPVAITYTFDGTVFGSGISSFEIGSNPNFFDNAVFDGNFNSELVLNIYLGATNSFVGYTGGSLCSEGQFCGEGNDTAFSIIQTASQNPSDPPLIAGTLTSATPEPSSVLLAFGGSAAILALRRRKRRA